MISHCFQPVGPIGFYSMGGCLSHANSTLLRLQVPKILCPGKLEEHDTKQVRKAGVPDFSPPWQSRFFHPRFGLLNCPVVHAGYLVSTVKAGIGITSVSRYSRVRGMSKIDFAPAHTTAIGDLLNSVRSLEMSIVLSPPLCTPPMPASTKAVKGFLPLHHSET